MITDVEEIKSISGHFLFKYMQNNERPGIKINDTFKENINYDKKLSIERKKSEQTN